MSAKLLSGDKPKNSISVSEQILLIEYVIKLISESKIFKDLNIELNFLSSDKSCTCIRILDEPLKTFEYVDGSYDADIRFMFIYRRMSTNGVSERVSALDKINELGIYFDNIDEFVFKSGYDIESILQSTQSGLVYRDNSGIEDNGATFVLRYNKN